MAIFTDAKAAADSKVAAKTGYDTLGYMSWEAINSDGSAITVMVDDKEVPLLSSFSDIQIQNPKDKNSKFYCPNRQKLADMMKSANGPIELYMKVVVKPATKKIQPQAELSTEDMFAALGIVQAS